MVSFARPEQLQIVMQNCHSFVLDNGAFSSWKKGRPTDWPGYYEWVDQIKHHPGFDWAIVPDVIDGTEEENDRLITEWPHGIFDGVPVFHLHESLTRLDRLCRNWPRVALGSSGQFKTPGSRIWKARMNELRQVACDSQFRPRVRFHALRGLNPELFTRWCPSSADSVTVAVNIGIDCPWPEIYRVSSKAERGRAYAVRLEAFNSSPVWLEFPLDEKQEPVAPRGLKPDYGVFWNTQVPSRKRKSAL